MTYFPERNLGRTARRDAANAADGKRNLSLHQTQALSVAELAGMPATNLMRLQEEAAIELRNAKELKDWIDGAIATKYAHKVSELRAQLGKDTGIVHFDDEGVQVSSDVPKKPVWDQERLAEIADRIRTNGDKPEEFIDINYKVAERRYTAWPENLRTAFSPARTLKTGNPTFRLSLLKET